MKKLPFLAMILLTLACQSHFKTFSTEDITIKIPKNFQTQNLLDSADLQLADLQNNIFLVVETEPMHNYFQSIEKTADSIINSSFYYTKNLKKNLKIENKDTVYHLQFKEYDTGTEFVWHIIISKKAQKYIILYLWYIQNNGINETISQKIINSFKLK